jgi:hypothetical protein
MISKSVNLSELFFNWFLSGLFTIGNGMERVLLQETTILNSDANKKKQFQKQNLLKITDFVCCLLLYLQFNYAWLVAVVACI